MNPDFLKNLQWLEVPPFDFRELVHNAFINSTKGGIELRRLATYALDETRLHQLGSALIKARKYGNNFQDLIPFRLAILSNATTAHLEQALTGSALRYGIDLEVMGISYDKAFTAAVGGDPHLKAFLPDAILIAIDYRGIPLREVFGIAEEESNIINECTNYLQSIIDGVRINFGVACITQTIACPPSTIFGSADRKIAGSLRRIISEVNRFISSASDTVLDIATLAEVIGTSQWFDAKLCFAAKIPFSMPFLPLYADHVCRLIGAIRGKSRRVLVLDLDNTIWGGVVGDDGVGGIIIGNGSPTGEAFLQFQRKILSLRKRGIILAVSSKNDDTQARRPFREIPDMALKEDSFAAFHANWNDKAANIRAIAQELSLSLDSFVFVDDNPQERALVRSFLPEVAVPELPSDPALYSYMLDVAGYFEAVSFSNEDARRVDLYQSRVSMASVAPNDLGKYLSSLNMKLLIEPLSEANRSRAIQLVNKSNQFNLTTRRLTDADLQSMLVDANFKCFALRLTDKFDDHGIISVIICELSGSSISIPLWVMSCRVIGRGVEIATMSFLTEKAKEWRCTHIKGQYIPTARNHIVEGLYLELGFNKNTVEHGDNITNWSLNLDGAKLNSPTVQIINQT